MEKLSTNKTTRKIEPKLECEISNIDQKLNHYMTAWAPKHRERNWKTHWWNTLKNVTLLQNDLTRKDEVTTASKLSEEEEVPNKKWNNGRNTMAETIIW